MITLPLFVMFVDVFSVSRVGIKINRASSGKVACSKHLLTPRFLGVTGCAALPGTEPI